MSALAVAAHAGVISAPLVAAPYASSYTAHVAHHAIATPVASYVAAPAASLVAAPAARLVAAAPLTTHYASSYVAPAVSFSLLFY